MTVISCSIHTNNTDRDVQWLSCRGNIINLPNNSNGVMSTCVISYLCVCTTPLKGVTGFCSTTWTAAAKGELG